MLDKLQQILVPSIHAIYFMLVFQAALCLLKIQFPELSRFCWLFKKCASTGNRTLVYRVAGDKSTTEPSMLDKLQQILVLLIHAIVFTLVFQVALCVSWMFKLSSSPVFVDCSKMCIDRDSNPGLSRGRRQFYHWTIDAWQIATITGSFHTCNLFHVGFPSCSVFVESSIYRALPFLFIVQKMCIDRESNPGLSRGRRQFYHWTIDAWQIATITGSFHTCNLFHVGFPGCSVFVESSIYRALLFLLIVQKMCIDRQSGNRTLVYRVAGDTSTTEPSMLDKLQHLLVLLIHAIVFTLVYQVALCVSWMFKLSSSPVFVDCSKMCIARESNPGLSRGRRQFYHWTIDAWQIATNTGSFHTCNLFHVGFPSCSVFVEISIYRALPFLFIVQKMCIDRESNPGLSRGRRQFYHWTIDAWQIATITGSFHTCNLFHVGFPGCSVFVESSIYRALLFLLIVQKMCIDRQSGNRTLVYRVAGDTSTTEPSMLDKLQQLLVPFIHAIVLTLVFQVALCVSWMFKLSSSPVFVDCSKMCIVRESNPGLSNGRRQFYHWTIDAWQIATITGSFHTCNLFQVGFPGCSVFVESSIYRALLFLLIVQKMCIDRQSGNRTLVYRVAGDTSTTEPSMLDKLQHLLVLLIHAIVFTLVYQVALCVSWMFKLSSSPVFVDCSKMCIARESNPGLSRGRRQFYHWTIDAWQIATNTGSFHTCNLFHVGFPSCSVFVEISIYRALPFLFIVQKMCIDRESNPGLSRGRRQFYHWTIDAWQIATITGSFHTCNLFHVGFPGCSVFVESSIYRALLFLLIVQKMCIDRQSGNRTLVYRVAGDTSTTEPSMLDKLQQLLVPFIHAIVLTLVFQVALCVSWMFKLSSSPVFVDCSKMCIVRESNPGLSNGRRQFYHWTIDAWQIATITGSFHTCNLFHVGFPSCSVFVEDSISRALPILLIFQKMCIDRESNPGLSRGRRQFYHWTIDAWQIATITGSFHTCNLFHVGFPSCSVFVEDSISRDLPILLIVQKMCIDRQ